MTLRTPTSSRRRPGPRAERSGFASPFVRSSRETPLSEVHYVEVFSDCWGSNNGLGFDFVLLSDQPPALLHPALPPSSEAQEAHEAVEIRFGEAS
jgi:hypothetical protein